MTYALVLVFFPALLWGQPQSENFVLTKSVIDAGGGHSSSTNYNLVSAFGQPTPVGVQSSAIFNLYAGFLSPVFQVSPLSPLQRLVIKEATPDARLYWETRAGAGTYSIYRAATVEFTPGPGNFVATVTDTFYTDVGVLAGPTTQQYYVVIVNSP